MNEEKEKKETITADSETIEKAVDEVATDKATELSTTVSDNVIKNLTKTFEDIVELMEKRIPKEPEKDDDKVIKASRIEVKPVKHRLGYLGIAMAKSAYNNTTIVDEIENMGKEISQFGILQSRNGNQIEKTMSTATLTGGGILVPEIWADDIIPLLEAEAVVRKAGASIMDMPNGNITMPRWATGIVGYWKGENTKRTSDEATLDAIDMKIHTLAVDVPISNDVLQFAKYNTAKDIERMMITGMANTEDTAFLEGTGTSYQPQGMKSQAGYSVAATATPTAAQAKTNMRKLIKYQNKENVKEVKRVWIMHPRERDYLLGLSDANYQEIAWLKNLEERNSIAGYPVFTTTNLSTSGGSSIYLIDMGYVVIGEGEAPNFEFDENGMYYDGSSLQSGKVNNMSVFRATEKVDIAIKQADAVTYLSGVSWGA